jgi:peptidoglycan/LPS O-acetylase OafA/YrhL
MYLALLLSNALVLLLAARLPSAGLDWLANDALPPVAYLTFTQNVVMALRSTFGGMGLAVTWSLALEEQFYLLLPPLVLLVPPRWLPRVLIALIACAPLLRTALCVAWPERPLLPFMLLPCRWDTMFLGVLVAIALRSPVATAWLRGHVGHLWALGGLLFAGYVAGCVTRQHMLSPLLRTVGYSWLALLHTVVLLLALLTPEGGVYRRLLAMRGLVRLGTLSYSVYLSHQLIAGLVHPLLLRNPYPSLDTPMEAVVTIVGLGLSLGLATLTWRLIERPALALGRRVQY